MNRPKSRLAPALIVAAATLLAVYVGGYFATSSHLGVGDIHSRDFGERWQCTIYAPMARVEAAVRGGQVIVLHGNEFCGSYPDGP